VKPDLKELVVILHTVVVVTQELFVEMLLIAGEESKEFVTPLEVHTTTVAGIG
jgi:hypothetical protein